MWGQSQQGQLWLCLVQLGLTQYYAEVYWLIAKVKDFTFTLVERFHRGIYCLNFETFQRNELSLKQEISTSIGREYLPRIKFSLFQASHFLAVENGPRETPNFVHFYTCSKSAVWYPYHNLPLVCGSEHL